MRIFITGSADGLGQLAARQLIREGHEVLLHARHAKRGEEALAALPGAAGVVTGDLSLVSETITLAEKAVAGGLFDAVIHNAGVGYREPARQATADGLPLVFAVNTLAPYILTALLPRPQRLVYLSSGLHYRGDASLQDLTWARREWVGWQAYADSKLHDLMLTLAVARRWPDVYANAVEPGWVPTKMGGRDAPDSLEEGYRTQCWLATSADKAAAASGQYFYHGFPKAFLPAAGNEAAQEGLLAECARISGIPFPD